MVFYTFDDAITDTQSNLNLCMIEFDRWASQNPQDLDYKNETFRAKKNAIKMLKLKLSKLNEGNNLYRNTPKPVEN